MRILRMIVCLLLAMSFPTWAQEMSTVSTSHGERPASSDIPGEPKTSDNQIQSRGLEVFGCPLSLDAGAMTRCFQRVLDREGDRIRDQMQREFDRNPFLAKLDHERKILQAVSQLPLEPLMTCLKNASNQAQADLGAHVQRWIANPGNYPAETIQQLLTQTRADLSAMLREDLQTRQTVSALPTPAQTWDRSVQMLGRLSDRNAGTRCLMQFISPYLAKLKQSMVQTSAPLTSQIQQIFDSQTVAMIHQTRAQTIGRTLLTAAGGTPRPAQAAGPSTPLASAPLIPPTSPLTQTKPAVILPRGLSGETAQEVPAEEGAVISRGTIPLGGGYKLVTPDPPPPPPLADIVPDKASLAKMAKGMVAEVLLDPGSLQQLSIRINQVAQVGTNPQAAQTALAELRQLIASAQVIPPDVRFNFGWEVLRYAGHRSLDLYGTADSLVLGTMLKDLFGIGVMAQCGLFPVVGGIMCAPSVLFADLLALTVVQAIGESILEHEHKDLDRVMTEAKEPIRAGRDPQQVQATTGSMGTLVRELPKRDEVIAFADNLLENLYGSLFAYHQQVLVLAEAAARR